ncbi:hypothetical protein niasHT_011875 [Heterodera trifolii]|uniref:Effector protein n=1 Tax=Heterodera trifolii TaxID=157864 RepID=A0ABD2KUG2_9BILA
MLLLPPPHHHIIAPGDILTHIIHYPSHPRGQTTTPAPSSHPTHLCLVWAFVWCVLFALWQCAAAAFADEAPGKLGDGGKKRGQQNNNQSVRLAEDGEWNNVMMCCCCAIKSGQMGEGTPPNKLSNYQPTTAKVIHVEECAAAAAADDAAD